MALHFYYKDIENHEHLLDAEGNPILEFETLILLMMPMGMQEITAENIGEVWARLDAMQRFTGAFMHTSNAETGEREDAFFEAEDMLRFIGLRVNVAEISRTRFLRNHIRAHMDEQAKLMKSFVKKQKVAASPVYEIVDASKIVGADPGQDGPWEIYENGEFISSHPTQKDADDALALLVNTPS